MRYLRILALGLVVLGGSSACTRVSADPVPRAASDGLNGFSTQGELETFAARMAELQDEQQKRTSYLDGGSPIPPPPAVVAEAAEEAPSSGESITNNQELGVDEGAIVKNAGNFLIVLRRGRLFTIRHGDDSLEPVDYINAFPPEKDGRGAWYDEMLVRGNQIIVVGYSYSDYGTEINRFTLSESGELTYRDTNRFKSSDYYSSRNYASRLIGDELIFYSPLNMNWANWEGSLPAMQRGGEGGAGDGEIVPLVDSSQIHVPEPFYDGRFLVTNQHVVTRCDTSSRELECEAETVIGGWGSSFYVSRNAVYVWTSQLSSGYGEDQASTPGQLFRMPLDGSTPGAVQVDGSPVDQFSFREEGDKDLLRIVLRADGRGGSMWAGEFSGGDVVLANIDFAQFGDGSEPVPLESLRKLPEVEGWRFHNRYVGDYLLYSAGGYRREEESNSLVAVPLDGRDAQTIELSHGVTRFDIMGRDGVAIGPAKNGALGFSAISFEGETAQVADTYSLATASEGENRSQAFFYRPDQGSEGGLSGTLGLPVSRQLKRNGSEFLGSGSALFFLRRDNRAFSTAGEFVARTESAKPDNCQASCVDWYGNARPIFLGNRVFALMGYELVEGRLVGGKIEEVRRTDFAPSPIEERLSD